MSNSSCILDEVAVTPVALMPALPSRYGPMPSTVRQIPTPTGRKLQFAAPFFVRGLSAAQLNMSWPVVCGLLRAKGMPIYATVAELQSVPAASVPARVAVRFLGEPLVHEEVTTADAYELVNCNADGLGWGWPFEIASARDLKALVCVLRDALAGETPIGMSLPLNAKAADLRMCLDSSIDFLTLTHCTESLVSAPEQVATLAAHGIVSVRRLCKQFGRPNLPLLLDAPIDDCDHAIKLLALGATAVNVAKLVESAMPAPEPARYESKLTDSLLGSLPGVPKVVRELPQVERKLSELVRRLTETLHFTGVIDVAELNTDCLRGLNPVVAEQLGIGPITNR